jgi:hypothetical protein
VGKFSKIKKSKRISSSIEEKIDLLNKELVKTGMLSEIANSTSYVYTVTDEIPPVPEVPPTLSNVPDTTGILGDTFTQPTYGGVEGDSSTWATGWSSNDYLKNPNSLAGETGRPIVTSVPGSPYDSGGAGIVQYGGYFGTSVGYLTAGNKYKQILVGGLTGGTEDPTAPNARSPLQGGAYGGLTNSQYAYACAFWNAYQALINQYGVNNLPGKNISAWIDYNRFHHYQGGGEFATWTGGPKRINNFNSEILDGFYVIGGSNTYTSDPGSPYQPAYTTVISRDSLGDPNYYPGPIPSKIGNKWGLSPEAYNSLIAGYNQSGTAGYGNPHYINWGPKPGKPGPGYKDPNQKWDDNDPSTWPSINKVKGASQPTKVDDKLAASYPTDTALDKLIKDTKPGPGSGFRGLYDMQGYPIDPKTGRRLKGA